MKPASPSTPNLPPVVRCLTRRCCDWAKANRDNLSQFTWLWRAAILALLGGVGLYAWLVWDKVGLAIFLSATFIIVVLMGLILTWAILDLPRIVFYALFWGVVSLTSLLDLFFYFRYLLWRPNRVPLFVLAANALLVALGYFVWAKLASLGWV